MLKQMLAISVAVAAISFATPGTGWTGAHCDPICAPVSMSNNGVTEQGLARAVDVANQHGLDNGVALKNFQSTEGTDGTDNGGTDNGGTDTGGTDTGGTDSGGTPCDGC